MAGKGNALNAAQALISVISKERWSKYFIYGVASSLSYYVPDDYRVWLKELGFIEKRVELFPKDASFQGREGMRGNIKSVWMPFTDKIPEDIRDEFVEDIIDEFGERFPPDEQGYYHFNMMRLEVEAGKT